MFRGALGTEISKGCPAAHACAARRRPHEAQEARVPGVTRTRGGRANRAISVAQLNQRTFLRTSGIGKALNMRNKMGIIEYMGRRRRRPVRLRQSRVLDAV